MSQYLYMHTYIGGGGAEAGAYDSEEGGGAAARQRQPRRYVCAAKHRYQHTYILVCMSLNRQLRCGSDACVGQSCIK